MKIINKLKKLTKKQKIIIILISLIIILLLTCIIIINSEKNRLEKIEIGTDLYNKAYDMYQGTGFKNIYDKNKKIIYYEKKHKTNLNYKITERYYAIDYNYLKEIFTDSALKKLKKDLKLVKKNNNYYVKEQSNIDNKYLKTKLEIKSIHLFYVKFNAISLYCDEEYRVSYGTGCSKYKKITKKEKPFTIIKTDGKWKVKEFTKSN